MKVLRLLNPGLWGCSIALSWTWGLGLFFSVQMAVQFGFGGLLAFAIPNALGLIGFGLLTQHLSRRMQTSIEFEKHFLHSIGSLRWVFLLYQVVAIALTIFALLMYVFIPLGYPVLPMVLVILGASLLVGELFRIANLKWSHLVFSIIILLSILLIGWGGGSYFAQTKVIPTPWPGIDPLASGKFAGFLVPIIIGFLLGPWLDIQQWQRAIQIHREKSNIAVSYLVGASLFFGILLFHGTLAIALWGEAARLDLLGTIWVQVPDGLVHVKDSLVLFLFRSEAPGISGLFQAMYVIFLCLCIISTLDSGYVALKWFQTDAFKKSDSVLMSLIPASFLTSPIPPFALAALLALVGVAFNWQLEYFISLYGSFTIGYSLVFLFRSVYEPRFASFTQTTLVSLAGFSLGVFGIGYFQNIWWLMGLGAIFPLAHAVTCIATRKAVEEIHKSGVIERMEDRLEERTGIRPPLSKIARTPSAEPEPDPETPRVEGMVPAPDSQSGVGVDVAHLGGTGATSWFDGKWFVHKLVSTYQDTNSVGNVYFAQYAMWVGKTRELFFHQVIPGFDLKNTRWYILTRAFEHKFMKETTEFQTVEVKIRIAGFNRKFVTMEHQVYDSARTLLGKGKQVLLFVSSADYTIIDIPAECHKAFLPYV